MTAGPGFAAPAGCAWSKARCSAATQTGDDMIHACQARIVSDLEIVDRTRSRSGLDVGAGGAHGAAGARCHRRRPGSAEAASTICPASIARCSFAGFPARCYSPTYPLEGRPDPIACCISTFDRFSDGAVSPRLARTIRIGHRVQADGPAWQRLSSGQIIPAASAACRQRHRFRADVVDRDRCDHGAAAARTDFRGRRARRLQSFYMHGALCRLALFPNVTIMPVVTEPQNVSTAFRSGLPTEHLPLLSADDIVYTSGAPGMTDHIARVAKSAGARCYADPFVSNAAHSEQPNLMSRLAGWLDSGSAPTLAPQYTPQAQPPSQPPQAPPRKPAPKMRMPQDAREYRPRFARSEISNSH